MPADPARLGLYVHVPFCRRAPRSRWRRTPPTRRGRLPGAARRGGDPHQPRRAIVRRRGPRHEISNFARPGSESRHNSKYWADALFLGFGMSAHSYREGRRWWNVDTFGGYCRAPFAAGLLERRGAHLRLTERGVLLSNEVFQAFV